MSSTPSVAFVIVERGVDVITELACCGCCCGGGAGRCGSELKGRNRGGGCKSSWHGRALTTRVLARYTSFTRRDRPDAVSFSITTVGGGGRRKTENGRRGGFNKMDGLRGPYSQRLIIRERHDAGSRPPFSDATWRLFRDFSKPSRAVLREQI